MSHLEALAKVSFDLDVFARAARQRLRRTFGYLLLLVVLSTVATTTWMTLGLRDLVRRLEPYLDQIPTITIRDGEVSADVEQPWVKRLGRDDAGHEVVAIIDTTGTREDFAPNEIGLFLKKRELVIKTAEEQRTVDLKRVPDTTFGPDIARALIAKWMRRAPFILAAIVGLWFLLAKTMQALLLVLAALIGSAALGAPGRAGWAQGSSRRRALGFGALFSVAVYALTPAVLLACALPFIKLQLPMFWLLYTAIAVAYAILGGQRAAAQPPTDTDTAAL